MPKLAEDFSDIDFLVLEKTVHQNDSSFEKENLNTKNFSPFFEFMYKKF